MADTRDLAFSVSDLSPLHWLGSAASAAVGDVWKAAMTALWSAGLWVLGLAFKIIDAFTTPDLSSSGPLSHVLPYTFAIGGFLALTLGLVQIGVAAWKRDGQSIARVMVGVVQFWGVWIGYVTICAVLVTATAGLTKGLLSALLHVDAFSGIPATAGWPTQIGDTVVATVLGLCTIFIIFPASIGYVLLMLVREAALLILASTSPISAAGLLSESTRAWFWKSFRWFLATLLMSPLAALVLGIGIQICEGTIEAPKQSTLPRTCTTDYFTDACQHALTNAHNNFTAASVGIAVTGCLIILIGAICPLLLFRLLAFVDPGTPSGAAMRASFAANGGMAGLLSGKGASAGGAGQSSGSGAATKHDSGGRSAGEASADTQTAGRFSSMLGGAGQVMGAGMPAAGKAATRAAAIGSDVLGSAGVGHQAPYVGHDSDSGSGVAPGGSTSGTGAVSGTGNGGGGHGSGATGGSGGGDGGDGGTPPPTAPTPPMPQPPAPPMGEVGADGAGVAAEVPVVPV